MKSKRFAICRDKHSLPRYALATASIYGVCGYGPAGPAPQFACAAKLNVDDSIGKQCLGQMNSQRQSRGKQFSGKRGNAPCAE